MRYAFLRKNITKLIFHTDTIYSENDKKPMFFLSNLEINENLRDCAAESVDAAIDNLLGRLTTEDKQEYLRAPVDKPVRPVRCWYCGQQMHYNGHAEYEPEVRLTMDTGDTNENLYLHTRCWNDWQTHRP